MFVHIYFYVQLFYWVLTERSARKVSSGNFTEIVHKTSQFHDTVESKKSRLFPMVANFIICKRTACIVWSLFYQ